MLGFFAPILVEAGCALFPGPDGVQGGLFCPPPPPPLPPLPLPPPLVTFEVLTVVCLAGVAFPVMGVVVALAF